MHPARFARIAGLALFLGCWAPVSSVLAGQARLVEGTDPGRVVIETMDASADDVLAVLAAHFDFAVERNTPPGQTVRFSGRLEGSLDRLLARLLRHEGHLIVRSAEARGGISRVVLLEGKSEAPPSPTVAGPIATLKARLGLKDGNASGK